MNLVTKEPHPSDLDFSKEAFLHSFDFKDFWFEDFDDPLSVLIEMYVTSQINSTKPPRSQQTLHPVFSCYQYQWKFAFEAK